MSTTPNWNPNVISTASGTISPGYNRVTYNGVTALTLNAPAADGQECTISDEGGHAHVITVASVGSPPTQGLNGIHTTVTFNGTAGSSITVVGIGANWFVKANNGTTIS